GASSTPVEAVIYIILYKAGIRSLTFSIEGDGFQISVIAVYSMNTLECNPVIACPQWHFPHLQQPRTFGNNHSAHIGSQGNFNFALMGLLSDLQLKQGFLGAGQMDVGSKYALGRDPFLNSSRCHLVSAAGGG